MSDDPIGVGPYSRDRLVDKPGIVGARWWHDSLADQAAQIARRDAIRSILIAGAVIAGFGALLTWCVESGSSSTPGTLSDDYSSTRQTSLAMQRAYGWSFGAIGEPLVFDGLTTKPFEPGALHSLVTDLSPTQALLRRYFQPTLFDAPDAVPTSLGKLDPDQAAGFRPLSESVKPIYTPAMEKAYARGKSIGAITTLGNTALVVDLPGPEAVAFAAGAAGAFEPVFLFDNWPHPRGVVRAQETLSAAAYYQPLFAEARRRADPQQKRPPMFVLDRQRLTPYTDDATQFDNRYVAKLPLTGVELGNLGGKHLLYVAPAGTRSPFELDDLNDDLVVYKLGGVDTRVLLLDMFSADGKVLGTPNDAGLSSDAAVSVGQSYVPVARVTPYSVGQTSPSVRTQRSVPPSFATVPVVIAVGTGLILGSRYSRSGSWNRSGGSWGGG